MSRIFNEKKNASRWLSSKFAECLSRDPILIAKSQSKIWLGPETMQAISMAS